MIPIRLELRNFLPYRDPAPLDFTGLRVACISGENGAGKSSLLDAITWALWGKARTNSADELMHQNATEMRVAFTFALAGETYQVIRQRKAGKSPQPLLELQAQSDGKWRGISESAIRDTQDKISRLLRLDYDTFVNSAFLVQGRADEFTLKTPAERKKVLADILGLEQWEAYEERAKQRAARAAETISSLDRQIADLDAELARRAEYESDLAAAQAVALELGERVRAAEREWHDLEQARQLSVGLQRQIEELNRNIARTEKDLREAEVELGAAQAKADAAAFARELEAAQRILAGLDEKESEREQTTDARQKLAAESGELKGSNEAMAAEADALKKRAATLQAATEPKCPTCGQPLSEAERARLVAELDAEVEARRAKYKENQTRLTALNGDIGALDRSLAAIASELRDRPAWQKKVAELQMLIVGADEAKAAIERIVVRRDRWQANVAEDRAKRQKLESEAAQLEVQVRGAGDKQAELRRLQLDHKIATERVGAARQKLSALDNFAKQREARIAERARQAEEKGIYEELREAFGKRGVPAMIIEAAVPEIEEAANVLLNRMTGGRMHARIDTQREIKSGELREALDINIADELGTRPYENYSGGEQFRINFAIRIALSKLLARRAGAQLQTLIIDEGFGTQDAQGRERLVAAINAIQNDFERIFVITHIDELKDAFPARIEITKTPQGSQIAIA
ncbi:MAG: SMC family ATPase [Chloroflexi bacterium]|nr:SMC family ATPase [Chloroflexota bacterium]